MNQSVRILHDGSWTRPGGGARVARELARTFEAPVTVGHCAKPSFWTDSEIETTIAFQHELHESAGSRLIPQPLLELRLGQLFKTLEFDEDVLISSGTAAKWIIPKAHQTHIHYCHVPPQRFYGDSFGGPIGWGVRTGGGIADSHFASFVDGWLANSQWTAKRVRKHYGEDPYVLNPPIRTNRFDWEEPSPDQVFVMIGRLVDMKRPDVVAEAFDSLDDCQLVLIGDGDLKERCAQYDNVSIYTDASDWAVEQLLARATGGIAFAQGEHCGLTPKEMQAAGLPVIVPDELNLCNHVVEGETGTIVDPSVDGVRQGVRTVLERTWNKDHIQAAAERWGTNRFRAEASDVVADILSQPSQATLTDQPTAIPQTND